jgi:hypothetical protein
MTTYEMCKILIQKGRYEKNDMLRKLDIFLLGNRITEEEYKELVELIEKKETEKEEV